MDTYSLIINKNINDNSYRYGFYVSIRYNFVYDLCLVYRKTNKNYGKKDDEN